MNDPRHAGGSEPLDRRLRQLAAEQSDAAPTPHPWDDVERRVVPQRSSRRSWSIAAAAAAVVLVVGAAVVIGGRETDAPSTIAPGETVPTDTAPVPTEPPGAPDVTEPPSTTEPDDEAPDGATGVEIPSQLLLDGHPSGGTWTVSVADTTEQLDALLAVLEVDLDMEPIDFTTSVVIHFGPAASSSCPFGPLVAVRHDPATGYLYPDLPVEGGPDCTDDANPHAVVVAIDRADLPHESFTIWVSNSTPPAGVAGAEIRVGAGELGEPPPAPNGPEPGTSNDVPPGVTETSGVAVPSGTIDAGPGDVVAAHTDGDLWYHPGLLGPAPGEPFRLAEFRDPRDPVTEGPPPNQVDHVAGVYDGAVIYGDCCEPVSGNVLAADGPDSDRINVVPGYTPVLDPTGLRLASANSSLVAVIDLASATQWTLMLDDGANDPGAPVDVWGVTWTADGSELVLLTSDQSRYALTPLTGAVPLERGDPVPIDVAFDPTLTRRVELAGTAAGGAIAVAVVESDGAAPTTVRFHDPETLIEDVSRRVELPAGTVSVRVNGDELLWVDGDTLWHRAGAAEPQPVSEAVRAAWFVPLAQ